jgi:hypothetical protein
MSVECTALGAGTLPTTGSVDQFLHATFGPPERWDSHSAPLFERWLASDPQEVVDATVSIPIARDPAGRELVGGVGSCLSPVLRSGDTNALSPSAPIYPGDLAVVVFRGGICAKAAVYLGRQPVFAPLKWWMRQPNFLWIFYQAQPALIVMIADYDFVGAWRIEQTISPGDDPPAMAGRSPVGHRSPPDASTGPVGNDPCAGDHAAEGSLCRSSIAKGGPRVLAARGVAGRTVRLRPAAGEADGR